MNYTLLHDPQRKTMTPFSAIWNINTIPHAYTVSHDGKIVWNGNPSDVRNFELAIREIIHYRDGA
jgi:hypothetical protein